MPVFLGMDEYEVQQPGKIKRFLKEIMRVLHILKKPGREDYTSTVKVTGLGAAIIGAIGFVIFLLIKLLS